MTNKIIFTRGLPGSGKTTYALQWVSEDADNRIVISRDDIRDVALGGKEKANHSFAEEERITDIFRTILVNAIDNGKDVIIADMNLRPKYIKNIIKIARDAGVDDGVFEIVDFPMSLDDLFHRNATRDKRDRLDENVIRKLHEKFSSKENWASIDKIITSMDNNPAHMSFDEVALDDSLPHCFVFDMDGTLADMGDRDPYDVKVFGDSPNINIVNIAKMAKKAGYGVVISSGRSEEAKVDTVKWLEYHGVQFDEILMRAQGDFRGDDIVKYEFVKDIAERWFIESWFDDRNKVVDMLREAFPNSTKVMQVAEGDF